MTRILVNAVMILGLTWVGAQTFRHVGGRPTSDSVDQVQVEQSQSVSAQEVRYTP